MEINKKLQSALGAIATIILIVLAALPIYTNRKKTTSLEVKKINEVELTRPLNITRLSSIYMYDDSIPVKHLWQTYFVIKNTGETTIYGEGFEDKNICGDALNLKVENCTKLLSLQITESTSDAFVAENSTSLRFTQWRPKEYVELMIVSDGSIGPEIIINDREIKDATIEYETYSPEEQIVKKRFVDTFPQALYNVLWWIIMVVDLAILAILIIAGIKQYVQANDLTTKITTIIVWVVVLFLMFAPLLWML